MVRIICARPHIASLGNAGDGRGVEAYRSDGWLELNYAAAAAALPRPTWSSSKVLLSIGLMHHGHSRSSLSTYSRSAGNCPVKRSSSCANDTCAFLEHVSQAWMELRIPASVSGE